MPINQYTRDLIVPRQTARLDNPQAVQNAGSGARAIAGLSGFASDKIAEVQQQKQTREEVIQRTRALSDFKSRGQEEFVKYTQENDMTDPNAVKDFNTRISQMKNEILSGHGGGEDSRARLETQLIGVSDTLQSKMTETGYTAQKQFITGEVGNQISRISKEVYDNPESIDVAFAQLNGLFDEFAPALESVDELQMIDAAQSQVMESTLNSFIDVGNYEQARDLIDENPDFIEKMSPDTQRSALSRINNGLQAQEKERTKITREINLMQSAAKSLGVTVEPSQLFSAVTGITETETPEGRVQKFADLTGTSRDALTPEVIAKIGMGVDLPSGADIDMNKERTPDGGYTPKGIGAQIKPSYDTAAAAKIQVDKVLMQAEEFLGSSNKQAGLASMIAFQKLIDDGAAVREGDIKLSAQGNSALDNIMLTMERIGEGAIATPAQIHEMKKSAEIFGQSVLEAAKTQIDPFLEEASQKGYRMIDIGLPQQSYDRVFGNVKTQEDINQNNKRVEQKAKQYGMDINTYLEATAKKHNMTVEQVAKKLNYTGLGNDK